MKFESSVRDASRAPSTRDDAFVPGGDMGLFGGRRSAKDGAADDEDEVLFSGGSTVRLQQPGVVVRANGDEETAKRCV